MSTTEKPAILLVPGAWHPPTAFAPLTKYLESNGYPVVPLPLATVGAPDPLPNYDQDVSLIREAILKHGPSVVVLTHSYGGLPGASACKGLPDGAVSHFIFCCSFALPVGVSLMDALQNKPLPWFDVSDDGLTVNAMQNEEIFYNDIHDKETLAELVGSLKPHSYKAFASKNTYAVYEDVKCTYVVCDEDKAIPVGAQWGMVEGARKAVAEKEGAKGGMEAVTLEGASHTPFVSRTEELGVIVRRCAGEAI
ncbi:uncharacterized protein AB675_4500 [Cyphellophora attinorum]|uniref:AB hydrolase-1 domain-containing protein n=1 Tax=Cyphellophora attinorum TaxID=1664694 RepID=A0A0N0NL68_9EURO|nr:uncharacterized protein AB675_4500 [Phialophora attinorum]KPI38951.1 hypothetical protein AB675_4500 [Phialophora attinorum]